MLGLIDLVLPRCCVGCGATSDGSGLCAACRPGQAPVVVAAGGLRVVAAAPYEGAVRAALLRYKERGRRDLAGVLASGLVTAVRGALTLAGVALVPAPPVVLVPVPSSRRAAAARGGDHVLRLARRAGAPLGLPTVPALELTRSVRDSAGLDRAERARNVRAAMAVGPGRSGPGRWPPGTAALLVDDIVTTGATLREARRALLAAGRPVVGAAVVAATSRGSPGRDSPHLPSDPREVSPSPLAGPR